MLAYEKRPPTYEPAKILAPVSLLALPRIHTSLTEGEVNISLGFRGMQIAKPTLHGRPRGAAD